MPQNNPDTEFQFLIILLCVIVGVPLLIGFSIFINDFSRELKYINCEIDRNTGAERRYWIRKKRRLWLSLIPFVKYE